VSRILMPLPNRDFEPTEAAIPWQLARAAGHDVVVATERGGSGSPPAADPMQLEGLALGRFGASRAARAAYAELERSPGLREPVAWDAVDPAEFHALLL